MDILKIKAASLNADAVVDVTCDSAIFFYNCWSAKKCTGKLLFGNRAT